MALKPIEYRDASPAVRAVFDDIKTSRKVEDVNNFWKYLAHDPVTLKRTWDSVKEVMAPGALDPLTKEMIYLAVSVSNGCGYCIASHTAAARKAGMTDAMFGEVMAVTGMANETNRLANGYRVPIDPAFDRYAHSDYPAKWRGIENQNATLMGCCLSPGRWSGG
jgi:AhpD family alkylhydroperoxidase